VLDDAYNYMRLRSLDGKHRTAPLPPRAPKRLSDDVGQPDHLALPTRLLVWSTADKAGIDRIAKSLQEWDTSGLDANDPLGDLAYTLDSHRSRLGWRSFALAQSPKDLLALPDQVSEPVRVKPSPPRLGYVFSGQGAQWYAMGRELLCFASYEAELDEAGAYLATIGCPWQPKGTTASTSSPVTVFPKQC
jgi:acyl transferase domain-containing protein